MVTSKLLKESNKVTIISAIVIYHQFSARKLFYKDQNREDEKVGKSTENSLGYKLSKLPKLVFVLSPISKATLYTINTMSVY